MSERNKTMLVIILCIYEYMSVTLVGDSEKAGYVSRELEIYNNTSIEDRDDNLLVRCDLVMQDFKEKTSSWVVREEDVQTCKSISDSYDEHGFSGKFYDDLCNSLVANKKVEEYLRKTPLLEILKINNM